MKPKDLPKIIITKDGPYLISGNISLKKAIIISDKFGDAIKWNFGKKIKTEKSYALCRCGYSKNKPFCDGSHTKIKFDGTEIASKEKYLKMAEVILGPKLNLTDVGSLCASARFCDSKGGTWENVRHSDDPKSKKIAIEQACNCPAGRLVVWDNLTKKPIEPSFKPEINLIEDPQTNSSGPIWVKGGIEIKSSEGFTYEKRNRVTLCRCGKSANKPFCDGWHIQVGFSDGDKSLEKKNKKQRKK